MNDKTGGKKIGEHILMLKHKLRHAKELNDVANYFFDHIGGNEDFLGMGAFSENRLVRQVMVEVTKQITRSKNTVSAELKLIEIPEYNFVHGPGLVGSFMINTFYFKDIDVGLVIASPFPPRPGTTTDFARFSIEAGKPPSPFEKN